VEAVIISVASAWIGAIGIGLIGVCLRLNNAVLKLAGVVDALAKQSELQRDDIRELYRTSSEHAERLAVLETR